MVAVMVLLPPLAIDGGITGRWRTPFSLSDGTFSTHSATTVSAIVPHHIFAHVCKRAGLRGCRGTHGICHRATLNDNRSVNFSLGVEIGEEIDHTVREQIQLRGICASNTRAVQIWPHGPPVKIGHRWRTGHGGPGRCVEKAGYGKSRNQL